ncbi:hypothetical protein DL96DRAFT_1614042 [Flagelloscypha sp. PMI_526]|nr:hypothetical protein DL96DRAFT_1614042 [Flagelloscypha sp. PMI_526]
MGGVGETSFPERFEGLLHVLDPYLQYHSTHESPPVSFIDQEVSKSRGRSMLFTNGPGAFCFALSDTDDYDPPVGAFGSPPWSIPPISSHRSPTPNASFQFVADLGRRPEAAALISEALLSRVISGSILESVERVTLREFQPGRTEVCSWSTARWLQTVVHLPQLRVVDADLNYPCMALLSGLLDIRDERDELRQQTQLSSIPLPAPQLETLQLCRADWRLIANVPPLAGTTDHIAYGPFGGIGAYPMGPVSILPPLPPQPFASRRLAATAAQTIISNIGNPGTGVSSSANPLFSPASFASPPHLNPSEPASHPIVLDTVTLFGQEMPSMEVLRDLLVHPRPFATVLQTRKGASLPLKKLNIRKSQMSEEAFEKLQEVVSEVDWDDKTAYNWKRDLWESTIESTDDNLDALNNLVRKT